jgi:hypothetical protein
MQDLCDEMSNQARLWTTLRRGGHAQRALSPIAGVAPAKTFD